MILLQGPRPSVYNAQIERHNLQRAYSAKVAEREGREVAGWKLAARAEFAELLGQEGRESLIELGSGTGEDAAFFDSAGLATTAIDLTPANAAATASKGPSAAAADLVGLPFASQRFEGAYSLNCFLHLPKAEWPLALAEARRVLRPGAPFLLSVYGGRDAEGVYEEDSYQPQRFFAFFRDEELKALLGSLFEIERFESHSASAGGLHTQTVLMRKPSGQGERR